MARRRIRAKAAEARWEPASAELAWGLQDGARDERGELPDFTVERPSDIADGRHPTAQERDELARARDAAAAKRDAVADARDRAAARKDRELQRRLVGSGTAAAISGPTFTLQAARDRERTNRVRHRAAAYRDAAARDRELAARDRVASARDRAAAASERRALAQDALTGAWQRGPGLEALAREIERARRGRGQLVVVYIDVNGLKATNDRGGHRAGDAVLCHVVDTLRSRMRPYELIVRVGGDEFVCALSEATLDDVRRRFEQITDQLTRSGRPGAITTGFAELLPDDSVMELVDRADRDFLARHTARVSGEAREVGMD